MGADSLHGRKGPRDLYRIAKRAGVWDPEAIPLAEDRPCWDALEPDRREQLLKLVSLFYEGETSVADTLAWWLVGVPDPDRRAFLSSQVFEEVKHAEFFALCFRDIFGRVDTASYLGRDYRGVLVEELRDRGKAIGRAILAGDERARERAVVLGVAHYMSVIEGMMAVTGYDYFDEMLATRGIFPRLLEGVRLIRADEGRHIAHGMEYLRERLGARPDLAGAVRDLLGREGAKVTARTDFIFEPNAFDLDRDRMLAIARRHIDQRMREMGLAT